MIHKSNLTLKMIYKKVIHYDTQRNLSDNMINKATSLTILYTKANSIQYDTEKKTSLST